jgi:hypothetical protein
MSHKSSLNIHLVDTSWVCDSGQTWNKNHNLRCGIGKLLYVLCVECRDLRPLGLGVREHWRNVSEEGTVVVYDEDDEAAGQVVGEDWLCSSGPWCESLLPFSDDHPAVQGGESEQKITRMSSGEAINCACFVQPSI